MEAEPFNHMKLEELGLNTCSHDLFLSFMEVPSVDEPKPQPLPKFPSLDVNLGDKRGPEPPIIPHSPDSFRIKVVDNLTIHTSPSPYMASVHPKSLGVNFSNLEMTEDDWELESKEVSFLGRGRNLPIGPKEVEKVRIKYTI
ncbi:hypothetical protein Tco_0995417 [Tanacetum coccineum]